MVTQTDLRLVNDITKTLKFGCLDHNPRPTYADGSPAHTYFLNHVVRSYNLSKEFPICTLRPIAWKSAIKEILWIYQDGSNDLNMLRDKYHIHYWDQWESVDMPGTIGQRYGATVRKYDSMRRLIHGIREDPYGRRHIISLWQEEDFKESDGLLPCAFLTIWNVRDKYLDMMLIQRSGDMIAASGAGGINEVQYAALQIMVAHTTGYFPGKFTHVIANEQIYDRHIDVAKELVSRLHSVKSSSGHYTYQIDQVKYHFEPSSHDFYDYQFDNFQLIIYNPQKPQLYFELGI